MQELSFHHHFSFSLTICSLVSVLDMVLCPPRKFETVVYKLSYTGSYIAVPLAPEVQNILLHTAVHEKDIWTKLNNINLHVDLSWGNS